MIGNATKLVEKKGRGGERGERRGGGRGGRRRPQQEPREFDQRILELSRVTRVTAGGKRMRFRVCLIIGDRNGRVGYGVAKGADVQLSVEKAFRQAKKHLMRIPLVNETISFPVLAKYGASKVLLKPAPKGTGIKSGGAVRVVLELAGVPNIVSKSLGSSNKINNARATFDALEKLLATESTLKRRLVVKKDVSE
ncbi:MAG: 30S ribosomal protein S5 [Patescibacteria group bacterium]